MAQKKHRLTAFQWKILVLSAMGIFIDGFDLFIIAVALPLLMEYWHLSPSMAGLLAASAPLGSIFGALILGRFNDQMGRKAILIVGMLLFIVFNIGSALSTTPLCLFVMRFMLGVGIGADYPTGSTYVSETMPSQLRGKMIVANFGFQALGAMVGAIFGLFVLYSYPEMGAWRLMLAAGMLPAIILLCFRMTLPESPRWLLNQGRDLEAKKIAEMIAGSEGAPDLLSNVQKVGRVKYGVLFDKKYRKTTILSAVPWFLMDISLYGVGMFTPVILFSFAAPDLSAQAKNIFATKGAVILDFFLIIGVILAMYYVDRIGRFKLQRIGFLGMFVGIFILAVSTLMLHSDFQMLVMFVGFILFQLMVNVGPNPMTYLIPVEAYPTHIRATGHGFSASMGKVGAALGIFLLPILKSGLGLGLTMLVIAFTALLGFFITKWYQHTVIEEKEDVQVMPASLDLEESYSKVVAVVF